MRHGIFRATQTYFATHEVLKDLQICAKRVRTHDLLQNLVLVTALSISAHLRYSSCGGCVARLTLEHSAEGQDEMKREICTY
jgi:hypothetical protein